MVGVRSRRALAPTRLHRAKFSSVAVASRNSAYLLPQGHLNSQRWKVAELAGADKSDPDPDLDTAYGREPKWTSHSLRRGADTAARQYREETGATEAQIDIFFGWHEKILLRAMPPQGNASALRSDEHSRTDAHSNGDRHALRQLGYCMSVGRARPGTTSGAGSGMVAFGRPENFPYANTTTLRPARAAAAHSCRPVDEVRGYDRREFDETERTG